MPRPRHLIMPRDIYSEEEKTDDFFLYKTVKTLSSFHIFCLLTKKYVWICNVVVKGLFNSPLMHLH